VAKGVYYPDEGIGQTNNDPTSTFLLGDNITLYGGFTANDSSLSERDWLNNLTVLSGDIDRNDDTNPDGVVTDVLDINGNNAYHVVTANGSSGTPITGNSKLDGFVITAGQANDTIPPHFYGGGLYCDGSGSGSECSPTLSNLTFSGNTADYYGGAIYNNGHSNGTSNPSLRKVTFVRNAADVSGGAMFNFGTFGGTSSPKLLDVSFINNSAEYGGAMSNTGTENGSSSPDLSNVIFSINSADYGGAMYNFGMGGDSSPTLINVSFTGNSATINGGGIYNLGMEGWSTPDLENVLFSGNSAGSFGGAIYNDGSNGGMGDIRMTNTTFSGNKAGISGGAVFSNGLEGTGVVTLNNSIFWNNQDSSGIGTLQASIFNAEAAALVTSSLLQGAGASGTGWTSDTSYDDRGGNIDKNPGFITPVDPSSAPTVDGNLRLKSSSPVIEAGKNSRSNYPFDLDNLWRIRDGDGDGDLVVDMGAYEHPHTVPYEIYTPLVLR
jgi:predicted outer membrane repeat protein